MGALAIANAGDVSVNISKQLLWTYIAFVGSVWFTSCQLYIESGQPHSRFRAYVFASAAFSLVALYLNSYTQHVSAFFLFVIAAIALLIISPFCRFGDQREEICVFSFRLALQIMHGAIASAVALIGIGLTLMSLQLLLGVSSEKLFIDIVIIVSSLFFSTLVLMGIPRDFSAREQERGAQYVYLLIGYLVIPILLLYCAILHWYFLALVFTQELPQGVIVFMSSGFGCVGTLVYLAVDHPQASKSKMISFFQAHYFKLLVVPLILMGTAIGIRINQHGFTPARQIVLAALVWLALLCAFSIVKRPQYLSRIAYGSLAALMLVTGVLVSV